MTKMNPEVLPFSEPLGPPDGYFDRPTVCDLRLGKEDRRLLVVSKDSLSFSSGLPSKSFCGFLYGSFFPRPGRSRTSFAKVLKRRD